ncbi:MAG: RIP metalloprotease RseP [Clostridia bacterium]|nr:RIP metalloprotease RseP [Clostridia bacterium]
MGFLIGALKVIILIGTLIILHEFGHFIVAKLCNIKVLKFSIGFGPKLIKKQGKETEYSLRAIPLGGFVQLEGEDEDSNDERSFTNRPIWQRLLVLLAGVTMNIIIALFIYLCIYMSINDYITTKIAADTPIENLAEYGLKVGEQIIKINGEKVYNDSDVARIINDSPKDDFKFLLMDQNNKTYEKDVTVKETTIGYVGIVFEGETVYQLIKYGPGYKAGLEVGDSILSINGESGDIYYYISILKNNPEKNVTFKVLRDGKELELNVVLDAQKKRLLNISFIEVKDLDFLHNLSYAWNETKYYLRANFIGIAELIRGKTENVEVQGIVGISQQISKTKSFIEFFYLMSAISLSLGIMNLLPVPGLDGGKVLITLIELFRGKPIKKETEMKITLIGFALLLFLMIWVTTQDISKLIK